MAYSKESSRQGREALDPGLEGWDAGLGLPMGRREESGGILGSSRGIGRRGWALERRGLAGSVPVGIARMPEEEEEEDSSGRESWPCSLGSSTKGVRARRDGASLGQWHPRSSSWPQAAPAPRPCPPFGNAFAHGFSSFSPQVVGKKGESH